MTKGFSVALGLLAIEIYTATTKANCALRLGHSNHKRRVNRTDRTITSRLSCQGSQQCWARAEPPGKVRLYRIPAMRLEMLLAGTAASPSGPGRRKIHAIEITKQPEEPGCAGGRAVSFVVARNRGPSCGGAHRRKKPDHNRSAGQVYSRRTAFRPPVEQGSGGACPPARARHGILRT